MLYFINIEELELELYHISNYGWDVGLHVGHEAYDNPVEIKSKNENWKKYSRRKLLVTEIIIYGSELQNPVNSSHM